MLDKIKHQYIPIVKSLIIIGLAALSVFLTARLWLVHIPNHNFVPYVRARFASTVPDEASDLVRPFRIVQGSGDGYFSVLYRDIQSSDQWYYGEQIIADVLQNGNFIGQTETDMMRILDAPIIIYQYAFNMRATVFAEAFGPRMSAVLVGSGIPQFDAVAIHVSDEGDNTLNIFFIGETYTWEFALLNSVFELDIPSASENVHHLVFVDYRFVSRLTRHFTHSPVSFTNPYRDHAGQLNLSHIRGQISHFFANPATINQGVSAGGVYTFSNLSTVVRYMPWDVIEYTSFRTISRSSPTSFVTDFSAAFAFVSSDPNIRNDFFLAGYEDLGRERVFWFGYTVGNFPIRLTEYWHTGPECANPLIHPIEVTVDNGRVIRYRKIVYNFAPDPGHVSMASVGDGELSFPLEGRSRLRTHIALQAVE